MEVEVQQQRGPVTASAELKEAKEAGKKFGDGTTITILIPAEKPRPDTNDPLPHIEIISLKGLCHKVPLIAVEKDWLLDPGQQKMSLVRKIRGTDADLNAVTINLTFKSEADFRRIYFQMCELVERMFGHEPRGGKRNHAHPDMILKSN